MDKDIKKRNEAYNRYVKEKIPKKSGRTSSMSPAEQSKAQSRLSAWPDKNKTDTGKDSNIFRSFHAILIEKVAMKDYFM